MKETPLAGMNARVPAALLAEMRRAVDADGLKFQNAVAQAMALWLSARKRKTVKERSR